MHRRILILFIIILSVANIKAQQRMSTAGIAAGTPNTGSGKVYQATNRKYEAPRAMEFNEPTVTTSEFLANMNSYFNIPSEFTFVETASNTDDLGMRHRFMRQYYKGIPLEGLGYRVHEKNGFVTSANGKAIRKINDININTTLSEEQAFELAVQHLQTKDTIFRSGKKLIVSKNFTFVPESFSVAYQFDVDVSLIERWRISIDARNGQVINKVSLVNTCGEPLPPQYDVGTGLTNYYGTKTIRVEKYESGSSRLVGQTAHGGKIGTYDFRNASLLGLLFGFYEVYDFRSSNTTYNSTYHKPAVSVQWAAEQAYEYYFNVHSRNSFDNNGAAITSYVHVGEDLNNAFWNGEVLAFGDGSNNNPLVELDVVSHELTHAVTQHEANLRYYYEPGALNESFSDILGKAVEFTTFGDAATWQLARFHQSGGVRDISNPNLKGQPDTYLGDMWYSGIEDDGGVHTNSGVQNFWFYLLCEGGNGVNDNGVTYSVQSIGMDTAVNIVYRNLTEYLSSSSDYLDSRIGSLLAVADLYGKNSFVYREVEKAWDAVGVIDEPIITSGLSIYDITATTVKLKGSFLPRGDTVTYRFEYGTTPELGSSTPPYDYTGTVEGKITGLQSETKYYVRFVATNENGSTYGDATEFTTISLAPMVSIKNIVDVTESSATLYGQVNPNSLPTSFHFEYGPTPEMGLVSTSYLLPDTTEYLNVSAPVMDLQPRQTYYYKLIATNDYATSFTDSLSFFTALKPVISAITPVTASIGTEVTITGQHFNVTPEKNLVNFGATRATVLSASSTEIKVKVPAGASFGPITLTDAESGLATESVQEFVPTYNAEFGKGNLQLRAAFDDVPIGEIAVHDMDSDGRPDIVASHGNGITVFQNANTGGDITNESFIKANIPINRFSFQSLADFDRNGLKDIIGTYPGGVRIYPNLSVPGYIFFGVPIDLSINLQYIRFYDFQTSDFDNDGRIDIAGIDWQGGDSSMFVIFRNQSPKGALSPDSFEQRYSKTLPYIDIDFLTAEDLNNDGSIDLMISSYRKEYFSILKNESSPGAFQFQENIVQDSVRSWRTNYVAQDLNQDGWKDITSHSTMDKGKISIYENNGPEIILSKPIAALDEHTEISLQPGDVDGDGKVDLLIGDEDGRFIFLKNKTEAGERISDSSFVLFEHYGINDNGREVGSDVILNDLNGDGRPEVINNLSYGFYPFKGHQLEIWQNAPNDCLDPSLIKLEVSRTSATIVLPANTTLDDFAIEYALAGNTDWKQVNETTLYLYPGASYQLRARAKCYLGFTSNHYINFTTECVDLASFSVSNIYVNRVRLSPYNLRSFEVQYSQAGKDQWISVSRYASSISNLLPGTTYDLRYRGRCYTPTEFSYTQFTTLCPTLSALVIEDISFNEAVVTWTSSYAGDAILEYSNDNITWTLTDETQTLFPLIPGKEYFVRGRPACTDINSDFIYTSFITPCPEVSMLTINTITPFSANVSWIDESNTGSYTVRYSTTDGETITMTTNSTSLHLESLAPGTEYTVSVAPDCIGAKDFTSTTFSTVCYVPFNLLADAITHTTAELSWDDNFIGIHYLIDYSIVGSNIWLTTGSAETKVSLEDLRPGTEYEARVHIECPNVTEPYVSVRFETSLYGETVIAPNPTDNTVTLFPSKDLIGNRFAIYDEKGRSVADGELLDYTFDFSDFPAGVYILKVEEEEVFKIVRR